MIGFLSHWLSLHLSKIHLKDGGTANERENLSSILK